MPDGVPGRLGKRELGPYAFEDRMPEALREALQNENEGIDLSGAIPKLAHLLNRDPGVDVAYLCTDSVVQVCKLQNEGPHFCGYRNMQVLCLALREIKTSAGGQIDLSLKLSIPQLQTLIEKAWDQNINPHARVQTGGIKDTRKHVGTPEAEALLLSIGVPCTGNSFKGNDAWRKLLDFVETYFSRALPEAGMRQRIAQTTLPPIFLQRPGHSITIVGLERLASGKRALLVFDPTWHPPSAMRGEITGTGTLRWKESLVLRRYRKGERYLKRYNAFETLTIDYDT